MNWERSSLATREPMSETDWRWFEPLAASWPPPGFRRDLSIGIVRYLRVTDSLCVVASGRTESDGKRWLHVSASHPNRTPTWEKMCEVKRAFLGDRRAIQVHPPEGEYVNIHPYCLHLWCCLDNDGLPDFRADNGRQI